MLLSIPLSAQKMTVESMVHTPLDQTANLSENTYKDNNGEYGGLVKVKLAASGASFEGWVLKQQVHNTSEYWVFMAKGGSRLSVIVPGYLPLEVNFRDYDDCIIQSLHTYVLTITLPGGPVVVDDGMRYLAMVVKPKNATVLVDGDPQMLDENGELVVRLSKGTHRYQVSAVGYEPKEGNVEVGDNNAPLNVSLASNQATLRVECPTNGAEIFVNGQLKGKAPWSGSFMPGQYLVEARLNGYRTGQQSVSLKGKEDRLVSIPKLEQVYGILDVSCRPVGSEVYVDGVKVGISPNTFRNVPVGERRIEVRKEGYQTMEKTVIIRESGKTEVPGTLVVASGSQGGDVVSTQGPSSTSVTSMPSALSSPDKESFMVNGVSFTMVRVDGGNMAG